MRKIHQLACLGAISVAALLVASTAMAASEGSPELSDSAVMEEQSKSSSSWLESDTLSGDWGGMRSTLSQNGITPEITYTADVMGNASGGIEEGTRFMDNLYASLAFDNEKLFGLPGSSAMVSFLNNNGGRIEDLVGSAQGVDNIEVPEATSKLYEAWVQQNFWGDKLSILGGLYLADSEFEVTDTSGLFLHSTYGAGSDWSQSGANGPAIFPFSALAMRAKVQATESLYAMGAIVDGVPGNPNDPTGTYVGLRNGDGVMYIGETGFNPTEGQKVAVGGWTYSNELPQHTGGEDDSYGMYILGEMPLYTESEGQGLAGFARLGYANGDVNQFDYAWSTGLVYTGLFEGRDEGKLGFAVSGVNNSDDFQDANPGMDDSETAFELTYGDNLTPWLRVQPDVQYVLNPGTDPALDDALVVGVRTSISF